MKKITLLSILTLVFFNNLLSQTPNLMSYQAVIWDASGNLVSEKIVSIKISILQGSVTGTSVYSETHRLQTNVNGLVSLMIGGGTNPSGKISNINWGEGSYFLKTETDPTGGGNYSIIGTVQLVSVPYALYSGNIQTINQGLPGQTLSLDEDGKLKWIGNSFPIVKMDSISNNSGKITLFGRIISNGGTQIIKTGILLSSTSKSIFSDTLLISNYSDNKIVVTFPDLKPNTKYYFKIFAQNSIGNGFSKLDSIITGNNPLKNDLASLKLKNRIDTLIISKSFKYEIIGTFTDGTTKLLTDSVKISQNGNNLTITKNMVVGARSGKISLNFTVGNISIKDSIYVYEVEVINVDSLQFLKTPSNPLAKIMVPVVVINYYPTLNGIDIDTRRAPSFGSLDPITIEQLKIRTIDLLTLTKFGIEEGSKFRGFNNSNALEDVGVKVIKYINVYEIKKTKYDVNAKIWDVDYQDLFKKLNIQQLVDGENAKEIWISMRPLSIEYPVVEKEKLSPDDFLGIWESNMSSKLTGDVSNSDRRNSDLPIYNKTYVVYGYNLHRGAAENLHNRGHQIEAQLSHVDISPSKELFWNKFVGFGTTMWGYKPRGRVGMTHFPPNTSIDYDYNNTALVESDIEDWQPDGGTKKQINSNRWLDIRYNIPKLKNQVYEENDAQLKWLIFWFQTIPNSTTNILYNNNKLENWWDIFYQWDNASVKRKTLWVDSTTLNKFIIKDSFFEKELVRQRLDNLVDGFMSTLDAKRIQRLDISEANISDLSGIEYFTNLETLIAGKNKITKVDVSKLTNLKELGFFGNQWLTEIDLSKNVNLTSINFALNRLTTIDLSKNINLKYIEISSNKLTSLDVSKNLLLEAMNISNNPSLKCVKVSPEQLPKINQKWDTGGQIPFLVDCK